jgi:putative Mg2+ transporter-C (MgtC) family protein
MPIELHWPTIALRLGLTVIAGGLLGAERSRTGHTAGLRTTMLVTLAASISMIQMNLLIPTNGKPSDSYAVMDLMRLPLGILTGVGFIGAGAIVHKGDLVLGVTTAATMWFATVVGLCLGGGQLILGCVSTVIGFLVLWSFRYVESRFERDQPAELRIATEGDELPPHELHQRLKAAHFRIKSFSVTERPKENQRDFNLEVRWPSPREHAGVPLVLAEIERLPGVLELKWSASMTSPQ